MSGGPDTFEGFRPAAFEFLRTLKAEQNKAWFEANRSSFEDDVRWPMTALVADLTSELSRRGVPLHGEPKRSIFRIHRDVRFGRNKSPYKTHIGATLTRDGGKLSPGLLYVHIDPTGCFAAAGFYRIEADKLHALREAIAAKPAVFRDVTSVLQEAGLVLSPDEDALKRVPRAFEAVADADLQDALRLRSFLVRRTLALDLVESPALVGAIADFAQAAMPLLAYGWKAIDLLEGQRP